MVCAGNSASSNKDWVINIVTKSGSLFDIAFKNLNNAWITITAIKLVNVPAINYYIKAL